MALDVEEVTRDLVDLTGLTPFVVGSPTRIASTWRFMELPRPFGIQIDHSHELGVSRATLSLDSLAAPLIESVNEFTSRNWAVIENIFLALDKNRISIQVTNQGMPVTNSSQRFDGTLEIHGRAVEQNATEAAIELMASMVSLFGFMAGEELPYDPETFRVEGTSTQILTRKYERSRFNRNIAIQIHGISCVACGFNFRNFYGAAGEGVIEVHHLVPVHLMTEASVVDPRTELVPLCSNCHTLVHRIDPPYTLTELRDFVSKGDSAK